MAKRMSQQRVQQILDRDLGKKYHVVQQGVESMDSKRKPRRTAVKTRKVKQSDAVTPTSRRGRDNSAPDEIVFIESNTPAGADAKPLRKAAVVSGGRVTGLQG